MDSFASRVRRQTERLGQRSLRTIEREVADRRVAWFGNHPGSAARPHGKSPRGAFDLVFFDYMGLSQDALPVVRETETEIEWLSRNPCPTLEACGALGLDTRRVCRAVYEKPTQALLSRLDPELRFLRSYEEIRPHAEHCRERIVRVGFREMMRLAVEEAKVSRREGNKGYGAVVVLGDRIIGRAHDTATTEGDPSLHAEVNAIRQAVRTLGDANLSGAILFTSCEPCPMCSSLAVWADLTAIVHGASIEETAQLGKERIRVGAREIVERSPALLEVFGGVLREDCLALYA